MIMDFYTVIKKNEVDLYVWAGNNVHDILLNEGINLQSGVYSMKHLCKLWVCVFMCLAKCLEKLKSDCEEWSPQSCGWVGVGRTRRGHCLFILYVSMWLDS